MGLFGYIRTSIIEDDPQYQLEQLTNYGCEQIFHEDDVTPNEMSLDFVLSKMQSGDVLIVNQLQCLGKSTRQLAEWMVSLELRNFDLVCLSEKIDTREEQGKIYFKWMKQIADMERQLLKERTLVGLNKARQQGKIGGRPKISSEVIEKIRFLFFEKKEPIQAIASYCNVSIGTCYKYIHLLEQEAL